MSGGGLGESGREESAYGHPQGKQHECTRENNKIMKEDREVLLVGASTGKYYDVRVSVGVLRVFPPRIAQGVTRLVPKVRGKDS